MIHVPQSLMRSEPQDVGIDICKLKGDVTYIDEQLVMAMMQKPGKKGVNWKRKVYSQPTLPVALIASKTLNP